MSNTPRSVFIVEGETILDEGILKPATKNARNNVYDYTSYKLRKNCVLFRGGTKPGTDVPAFFGPLSTAKTYSRGNNKKIYAYNVRKEPKLFQLSYENLVTLFDSDERLTPIEREALDKYLVVSENMPPYVVPIDFLVPENRPAEGRHPLYLNRRVLNIICRLGYDGWVVLPDTLLQRNLDAKHFQRTGKVRYTLNPYEAEVALCNWDEFLDEIDLNSE
jgi:hypothetical protein